MRLSKIDSEIFEAVKKEAEREENTLELIASENFVSPAVLEAMGSVMTNKYAEGYPGKRYYGGCEYVDIAESLAIERAKEIFKAEHVNVQPHSGTQANMAVCFSVLSPGDTIMGMNLSHGGHLSHGHPINFTGKMYKVVSYGVSEKSEIIDYDEVERLAAEHRPKLIIVGASAYPRFIDYKRFREIADKSGAMIMADIAHPAGLVAAGIHPSPVPYADFVTTTTHKTLRGPRGGMIMCREEHAKLINKNLFPGIQGGPLMHIIAAKAVAFKEAMTEEFGRYQRQVVKNAAVMAESLLKRGVKLVSGGTDNHLLLINLRGLEITGKEAEEALELAGITTNKNTVPFDSRSPFVTSGIRVGTPAITTRGMKEKEMEIIADLIADTLENTDDNSLHKKTGETVRELCGRFPLYKDRLPYTRVGSCSE